MTITSPHPFVAAYRFQLTPDDDFATVTRLVPYLRSLGISHLYLSPIAEAELGSQHGYDINDPTTVRGELGGPEALDRLCSELDLHGLGLILDIVPNHLSIATPERNPWFWDVLRLGRSSRHANAFDIDWEGGDGKVVLPVLTQPLVDEIGSLVGAEGADGPVIEPSTGLRLPISGAASGLDPAALAELVERQPYRLVPWQSVERNQRRFFEIDSLAGVAVEDEAVRRDRHALLAELLERWPHVIDGVRVDHIDGLADPDDYLAWLRRFIGDERLLLIEKILVGSEELPTRWPIDGTTGYEFARLVDRLLVEREGLARLRAVWVDSTTEGAGDADHAEYEAVEHAAIEEVLNDRLRPEVERIHRFVEASPSLTGEDGKRAIIALTGALGRYRTYLPAGGADDIAVILDAARRASEANPESAPSIDALATILTSPTNDNDRQAQTLFEQLTGPALAKGGEDRALYRHLPLAALNEVGGDPGTQPAGPEEFHRWATAAAMSRPRTLLTTTTHDTKRSGDVRARLLALSHNAERWEWVVSEWLPRLDLHPADGLLLLQTVVGAWPIDQTRLTDYLTKALREGALRSSWIDPDDRYETLVGQAVTDLLADPAFVSSIESMVGALESRACANSLTQTLLRLTAPGFGDLYRGDEIRDLSLVDPDNRRPLDWDRLILRSAESAEHDLPSALAESLDLAKLALIRRTLACRRAQPTALDYEPVTTSDPQVLAYRRGHMVVTVALGSTISSEATVDLPGGMWRSVLRSAAPPVTGTTPLDALVQAGLPLDLLARVG